MFNSKNNNSWVVCMFTCACLQAASTITEAASFYVNRGHVQASDSNPGTEALPWRTIQKAANTIGAGDTVYVQAGNYPEKVLRINVSDGTSGQRITFKAVGKVTVEQFYIREDSYVTIDGFEITSSRTSLDGGVYLHTAHFAIVENNYIYGMAATGIAGRGNIGSRSDDVILRKNHIYECEQGMVVYGSSTGGGWLVESNRIEKLKNNGRGLDNDGIRVLSGKDHIFRKNLVFGQTQVDIDTTQSNYPHVDAFQVFDQAATDAPVVNLTVDQNMFLDTMTGIQVSNNNGKNGNFTITHNIIGRGMEIKYTGKHPNGGSPINMTDLIGSTIIKGNTFYKFTSGAHSFNCKNVTFSDNISYKAGGGYLYTSGHGSSGDYNLIFGDNRPGPNPDGIPSQHDIYEQDPRFVINGDDIIGPDGIPFTQDDGLILQSSSPAIGTGENGVDMGAYASSGGTGGGGGEEEEEDTTAPSAPPDVFFHTP